MAAAAEFLFGVPDPGLRNKKLQIAILCVSIVLYILDNLLALVLGGRFIIWENIYDLPIYGRVLLMTQISWPWIISTIQVLAALVTNRRAKRCRSKWKNYRRRLVNQTSIKFQPEKNSKNASARYPVLSPPLEPRSFRARLSEIHPFDLLFSVISYITVVKDAGAPTAHPSSYKDDVVFHQWRVQNTQVTKVKYCTVPRLLVIIVLTYLDPATISKQNSYMLGISNALSVLAIISHYCFKDQLLGQIIFNHRVLAKKDSLNEEEISKLLNPRLCCLTDLLFNAVNLGSWYCVTLGLLLLSRSMFELAVAIQLGVTVIALLYCTCLPEKGTQLSACVSTETQSESCTGACSNLCYELWDFIANIWTLVWDLIAPASLTSLTKPGLGLSAALRVIPLVCYAAAILDGSEELINHIDLSTNFITHSTLSYAHAGPRHHFLQPEVPHWLVIAGGLFGLIPHFLLAFFEDSNLRLSEKLSTRHRKNCAGCTGVLKKYGNHRGCWVCLIAWIDQNGSRTPVPFFSHESLKSDSPAVRALLSILATIQTEDNADFLLCSWHAHVVNTMRQSTVPPPQSVIVVGSVQFYLAQRTGRLYVRRAGVYAQSVIEYARGFDMGSDMYWFLSYLYSPHLLGKILPFQMIFKVLMYDKGIRNPEHQDAYWRELKRIRQEHSACQENCKLSITDGVRVYADRTESNLLYETLGNHQEFIKEFGDFCDEEQVLLLNDADAVDTQEPPSAEEEMPITICSLLFQRKCDEEKCDKIVVRVQAVPQVQPVDDPG